MSKQTWRAVLYRATCLMASSEALLACVLPEVGSDDAASLRLGRARNEDFRRTLEASGGCEGLIVERPRASCARVGGPHLIVETLSWRIQNSGSQVCDVESYARLEWRWRGPDDEEIYARVDSSVTEVTLGAAMRSELTAHYGIDSRDLVPEGLEASALVDLPRAIAFVNGTAVDMQLGEWPCD